MTATLVDHHPAAPAFAYRFDTPNGSVVFSGDTGVSDNLIDLVIRCGNICSPPTPPSSRWAAT
ncbi:hypothetical protein [Streptomyces sp. BA2]|uniref:hypothetical protein n=1 Tax=Streptomyces sp. BA2 TaxID=436595 RepID=UPI0013263A64|nr:hypothetical protein [Streptomyces sp. BA2]MWA16159.1 hypothetical protein [Streptomyces sp. BA2]